MPNPGTGLDESSEATGERAARILLISASGYISSAAVASRNAGSLLPASYGPSRRANPIGKASVLFAKSGLFEFREPGLDVSMFLLQELDCMGGPPRRRGLARFLVVSLFVLLVGDLRRAFAIAVSPCFHSASSLR